jgi:hypothetical protein
MVYCSVSNGEGTAIWSTAVFLMGKGQRYVLLQGIEWRRDSNMAYCSVFDGKGTAIWSTAVFLMEKKQRYDLLQSSE